MKKTYSELTNTEKLKHLEKWLYTLRKEYVASQKAIDGNLIQDIMEWGRDKGINNPEKQLQKMHEETSEATTALSEDIILETNLTARHLTEEVGDMGVVWLLLCQMLSIDPYYALEVAHKKNKDRKGKTINGNFIKESDL